MNAVRHDVANEVFGNPSSRKLLLTLSNRLDEMRMEDSRMAACLRPKEFNEGLSILRKYGLVSYFLDLEEKGFHISHSDMGKNYANFYKSNMNLKPV